VHYPLAVEAGAGGGRVNDQANFYGFGTVVVVKNPPLFDSFVFPRPDKD
jgi:hypothetical protein